MTSHANGQIKHGGMVRRLAQEALPAGMGTAGSREWFDL